MINSITEKEFQTLRAHAAIRGYVLHRSEANDGPVVFFAERHGQLHYQPTVAALRAFVAPMQDAKETTEKRQPLEQVAIQ